MNPLQEYVTENPDITLSQGMHDPECGQCILELCSLASGVDWTDDPDFLELPDIRSLNDAAWSSDATRTQHLLRVGVAVWPWREANRWQKQDFAKRLAELTIKRVLPPILREAGLDDVADRCELEGTQDAAYAAYAAANAAARAAYAAYAAARAAYAAYAAANAAARAAYAASAAANAAARAAYAAYAVASAAASAAANAAARATTKPDTILITACDCWVEASEELSK